VEPYRHSQKVNVRGVGGVRGYFSRGSILYKKSASDTSDGSDAKEEPQKQDVRKERTQATK
jgi:hypothetical protein